MNPSTPMAKPRRRIWLWVLGFAGLCVAPFLVLGAVALSYVTLNRDARTLRNHVMAATDVDWEPKVQMSVGSLTLGAVRHGLGFVDGNGDIDKARDALRAVKHASVGVYERAGGRGKVTMNRQEFFADTDRAMQNRGWTRMVGVIDGKESVLIYVQEQENDDKPIDLCVAVVSDKELVVASTTIDARALSELVVKHAGADVKKHLRFASFQF